MSADGFAIRPIDDLTRDQYMDLCAYCFGMTPEARSRYCSQKEELAHSLGAFDGEKLAAGMWYFCFDMRVRDSFVPMAGVAAVATWPEYRNRGLVRAMLAQSQAEMRAEGRPLSVLQPFRYSFYFDLGWAPTFDVHSMSFEPEKIRSLSSEGYRVREVEGADEWETFEALNTRFGEAYNGPVCRSQSYWERRFFAPSDGKKRSAYLVEQNGEARGFIVARLTDPSSESPGRDLAVLQTVWLEPGAERAIFGFFRAHRDQVKRVKLFLPADVRIEHLFSDPLFETKLHPKMMTKLVDVRAAVEHLAYDPSVVGGIELCINAEESAPWNGGIYRLSAGNGKASLKPAQASEDPAEISIQHLAELYMGYRSAADLAGAGELSGTDEQLHFLDLAFPRRPTYIDDWF